MKVLFPILALLAACSPSSGVVPVSACADGARCAMRVVEDAESITVRGNSDVVETDALADLLSIDVAGTGTVSLASLETDSLDLLVAGNAAVTIDDLSVGDLTVTLNGHATASLAGVADTVTVLANGNAALDASGLVATTLDVTASGHCALAVGVTDTVTGSVAGRCHLDVLGDGDVDVSGVTGDVEVHDP